MSKRKGMDDDGAGPSAAHDDDEVQADVMDGISADRARRNRDKSRAIAQSRAAFYAHYDPNSPAPARPPRRRRGASPENDQVTPIARKSKEIPPEVPVDWIPAHRPRDLGPRRPVKSAPSLMFLCCEVVCRNIDSCVSFENIPDKPKETMLSRLHLLHMVTAKAVRLLLEGTVPETIRLPDCSGLCDEDFQDIFQQLSLKNLEVLELGFCGRALTDNCMIQLDLKMPKLRKLHLQGGYLFTDKGIEAFLRTAEPLQIVELVECSNITAMTVSYLPASQIRTLSLERCRQLQGTELLPSLKTMANLRVLSLAEIISVTDEVVTELVVHLGGVLEHLYLSGCGVGDAGVNAIATSCTRLETLHLDNNQNLTQEALTKLSTCTTIRDLSLASCNFGDDPDEALHKFLQNVTLRRFSVASIGKVGDNTLLALAEHSHGTLEYLNASFCRRMTDSGLGKLADDCTHLVKLELFGCSQVTTRFLNGHRNESLVVTGLANSCYRELDDE